MFLYTRGKTTLSSENSVRSRQQTSSWSKTPQAKPWQKLQPIARQSRLLEYRLALLVAVVLDLQLWYLKLGRSSIEIVQCLGISTSQALVCREVHTQFLVFNEGSANHKARMASFMEVNESHQWLLGVGVFIVSDPSNKWLCHWRWRWICQAASLWSKVNNDLTH